MDQLIQLIVWIVVFSIVASWICGAILLTFLLLALSNALRIGGGFRVFPK